MVNIDILTYLRNRYPTTLREHVYKMLMKNTIPTPSLQELSLLLMEFQNLESSLKICICKGQFPSYIFYCQELLGPSPNVQLLYVAIMINFHGGAGNLTTEDCEAYGQTSKMGLIVWLGNISFGWTLRLEATSFCKNETTTNEL
jgi:hypothetical protein